MALRKIKVRTEDQAFREAWSNIQRANCSHHTEAGAIVLEAVIREVFQQGVLNGLAQINVNPTETV